MINEKFWILVSAFLLPMLLITACDDFNIVNPRFYSDEQVVELTDFNSDDVMFRCDSVFTGRVLPTVYSLSAAWSDKDQRHLWVQLSVPTASDMRLAVIGGAGEVVKVFLDGSKGIVGEWSFAWCCTDESGDKVSNGVYGVSAVANGGWFKKTIWFKID